MRRFEVKTTLYAVTLLMLLLVISRSDVRAQPSRLADLQTVEGAEADTTLAPTPSLNEEQPGDDDDGEKASNDTFTWRTAAGRYTDPSSFFSLHGYVDGVFGGSSADWNAPDPTRPGPPGQLLVPNTSRSSFSSDAALFFAAEPSSHTQMMLEIHLVSDPSGKGAAGPGGLTLAVTEATASWDVIDSYLKVSGGMYWAPFGIVNGDWLGAENLFTLLPKASGAFPAHYNERGVRISGAKALTQNTGFNYVFSVGNGLQAFDISGQRSFDQNTDKTVTGRIGFFPGFGEKLNVGASHATGRLREAANEQMAAGNPQAYRATFTASGLDATWRSEKFAARAYFIHSTENLEGASSITRDGFTAEASYVLELGNPLFNIGALKPKFRFDIVGVDQLRSDDANATDTYTSAVYSLGVSLYPTESYLFDNFYVSLEYHFQTEIQGPALDNDRFVARITAKF